VLNKITCKNSGAEFELCNCGECQEDRRLHIRQEIEGLKANGYVLGEADINEVK
jgi:hypothetical protein